MDVTMGHTEMIFRAGASPEAWLKLNAPSPDLLYKSGQATQLKKLEALASLFSDKHTKLSIVGQHTSKSVPLPVACIKFHPYDQVHTYCFIRDNFYDIKLCVVSDGPVDIPYELIYAEWTEEDLKEEQQRYIRYPSQEPEFEKDEKRLKVTVNDDWYHEDWSAGRILRYAGRIYVGDVPKRFCCEGISRLELPDEVFEMYEKGKTKFGVSLYSYGQLTYVLEHIERSLDRYRSKWLDNGGRDQLIAEGRL